MKLEDFYIGQVVRKIKGGYAGRMGEVVDTGIEEVRVRLYSDGADLTYTIRHRPDDWEAVSTPIRAKAEPAQVTDWSYAEAQRLADAADAAIEVYNQYISKQPKTVFVPKIK